METGARRTAGSLLLLATLLAGFAGPAATAAAAPSAAGAPSTATAGDRGQVVKRGTVSAVSAA